MPSKFGGIPVEQPGGPKQSKFGGIPLEQAPEPAAPEQKGVFRRAGDTISDLVTGRKQMTPEIEGLPEVRTAPEIRSLSGPAFKSSVGLLTEADPKIVRAVIEEQFGDQVSFRQDEKGNQIARFPSGDFVLNRPGLSYQDALTGIFDLAAFTPAGRGAGFVAPAVKAAVTQSGIEGAGASVGGEFNPGKVPEAALLVGAGTRFLGGSGKQASAGEAATDASVNEAAEASRATGIPLFQAQQTVDPAVLEKQAFVAQLPAGAKRSREALLQQNDKAAAAVDELLISIAPDNAVVRAQGQFQNAAQEAIERARLLREEKTSPLFERAFKQDAKVNLGPVKKLAAKTLNDFPETGEVSRTLRKTLELIEGKSASKPLNLRQLANAKIEIDQMLSRKLDGSLGHQTKANLMAFKNKLLEQMDKASPLYQQARNEFYKESGPVNALEESIIGKIADLDPTQLKRISGMIFDPAQSNPSVVMQAKSVIDDVNPDTWSLLLRSEVERRMGIIRPKVGAVVDNIPGELRRAIFGNKKQRTVLMAGLNAQQKKNFQLLDTALGRAQLGRPGGSQTAAREEIKRELRGGVVSGLREFFRNPFRKTSEVGEDVMFDRRVSALTEVLFNPKWAPDVNRALKDQAGTSFGHLLYVVQDQMEADESFTADDGQ